MNTITINGIKLWYNIEYDYGYSTIFYKEEIKYKTRKKYYLFGPIINTEKILNEPWFSIYDNILSITLTKDYITKRICSAMNSKIEEDLKISLRIKEIQNNDIVNNICTQNGK